MVALTVQRTLARVALLLGAAAIVAEGQPPPATVTAQLRQLFPSGQTFSPKDGVPAHFKAFVADPRSGKPTLAGFAFWTTELQPLERGYEGPIRLLVGMDTKGVLTGIIVTEHHEPYGYFSIDKDAFAAQFKGKSIRDAFKVGEDIDAVSGASITVTSASRAVRNSARRIAREVLTPEAVKP